VNIHRPLEFDKLCFQCPYMGLSLYETFVFRPFVYGTVCCVHTHLARQAGRQAGRQMPFFSPPLPFSDISFNKLEAAGFLDNTATTDKSQTFSPICLSHVPSQGHLVKGEDTEAFSSPLWSGNCTTKTVDARPNLRPHLK
jgi:hypothetical protein